MLLVLLMSIIIEERDNSFNFSIIIYNAKRILKSVAQDICKTPQNDFTRPHTTDLFQNLNSPICAITANICHLSSFVRGSCSNRWGPPPLPVEARQINDDCSHFVNEGWEACNARAIKWGLFQYWKEWLFELRKGI